MEGVGRNTSVVLVGSHARGTAVDDLSDFDILIVGPDATDGVPLGFQVMRMSDDRFRERIAHGDDFAQWALRFGKPLSGRSKWLGLRQELLPGAPWPKPQPKIALARKKLKTAVDMVEIGDIAAAEEEARFAFGHFARAELLKRRVYPLSRPELADQVSSVGLSELANWLERLNSPGQMRGEEISESLTFLASCLETP